MKKIVKILFLLVGPAMLTHAVMDFKRAMSVIDGSAMLNGIEFGIGLFGTMYSITKLYDWATS